MKVKNIKLNLFIILMIYTSQILNIYSSEKREISDENHRISTCDKITKSLKNVLMYSCFMVFSIHYIYLKITHIYEQNKTLAQENQILIDDNKLLANSLKDTQDLLKKCMDKLD